MARLADSGQVAVKVRMDGPLQQVDVVDKRGAYHPNTDQGRQRAIPHGVKQL
jgi:hypothetical protein